MQTNVKNIIEFRNVSFSHGEKTILKNISFKVSASELVSLVGQSGCGKSTILALASGILKPNNGCVLVHNKPASLKNGHFGYMLQKDELLEWHNIETNATLGLSIKHRLNTNTKAHVRGLLKKYGLGEYLKSYPHQLSGGMRQRVSFVRTIALDPDLLLLDEPFSALDQYNRQYLADEVLKLVKKDKKAAIFVTHDPSEAKKLADRIIHLGGSPTEILKID